MRAIWVTPAVPHPQGTGGCAHEFELIRAMRERGHDIHVLSTELEDVLGPAPLAELGVAFTHVPWRRRPPPENRWQVLRAMPLARPSLFVWLLRDRIRALGEALDDLRPRFEPDLVHVTIGELSPVIASAGAPTALLLFDAMTLELEGRVRVEPLLRRRLQRRLEAGRMRRFERRWYRKATGLASVSSVDARWFEDVLGRPVAVLPNPIADDFFAEPACERDADTVAFIGTINHHPNEVALEWLLDEIWPRVHDERPAARLVVAGRGDPAGAKTALYRARIEAVGGELHADVDDIRPYYWSAGVAVTPIVAGAGMRNKVIHAMACGTPLVTTSRALEGVPDEAAAAALVADDAEAFARAVVEVLDDPSAARARADRAAAAVAELRTPAVAGRFEQWWSEVGAVGVSR